MGPAGLEPATYRLRVRSRVCACLRLIADWLSDAESPTCSELPFAARYRVVVVHLDGPGEKLGLTVPHAPPCRRMVRRRGFAARRRKSRALGRCSMVFRVPLSWKARYTRPLLWLERRLERIQGKRLSCFAMAQWRKKA